MLHTDKTAEQVETLLSSFTTGYLKPILFNLTDYYTHKNDYNIKCNEIRSKYVNINDEIPDKDFDSMWDEITKLTHNNPSLYLYDTVKGWFVDTDNIHELYEDYLCPWYLFYNTTHLDNLQQLFKEEGIKANLNMNGLWKYNDIFHELVDNFICSHEMPSIEYMLDKTDSFIGNVDSLDGTVLLLSESDNSIPYETFEIINSMFNGTNYHLG